MNGKQQSVIYKLFSFFPVSRKKIVLLDNFEGANLKEVQQYAVSSLENKVRVVRVFVKRVSGQHSLKGLLGLWHLATAKVVIANNHIDTPYKLRSDARYIQVWHASGAIKKFGHQMLNDYTKSLRYESKLLDYVICGSSKAVEIMAQGFGVPRSKVLPIGLPYTDRLFKCTKEDTFRAKEMLGVDPTKRVVLYAPTFRERQDPKAMLSALDLMFLSSRLPEDMCLAVRLHSNSTSGLPDPLPSNVIDWSSYKSPIDVLIASDILVSDYSAMVFEFSILERPIILFCYDLEEYSNPSLERGLNLYPGKELDFPVVKTSKELSATINCVQAREQTSVAEFKRDYFDYKDGKATKRLFDLILGELDD